MSKNNRDVNTVNKACTTVQANLYSLINKDSIELLENKLKRKSNETTNDNELCNQKKLIRLALDSNEKSNVLFNHSQKNIKKKDASR